MFAIQPNEQGHPVLVELVRLDNGRSSFKEVDAERWREVLLGELELSSGERPIVPVEAYEPDEWFVQDQQGQYGFDDAGCSSGRNTPVNPIKTVVSGSDEGDETQACTLKFASVSPVVLEGTLHLFAVDTNGQLWERVAHKVGWKQSSMARASELD